MEGDFYPQSLEAMTSVTSERYSLSGMLRNSERFLNMAELNTIIHQLEDIDNDKTVPKNIRLSISKVRDELKNEKTDKTVKISSAISVLDEAANDSNLPVYTRTQIMSIVSQLEVMNR